jgi:hypothetical protein
MGMENYGLRAVRKMIAAERQAIAAEYPRSSDPYVRGQRDALKRLDDAIAAKFARGMREAREPSLRDIVIEMA